MGTEDKKDLIVKFPEDEKQVSSASPVEQSIGATQATPDNPFDKGAELLPRALSAIKENFKEAIFLFINSTNGLPSLNIGVLMAVTFIKFYEL